MAGFSSVVAGADGAAPRAWLTGLQFTWQRKTAEHKAARELETRQRECQEYPGERTPDPQSSLNSL